MPNEPPSVLMTTDPSGGIWTYTLDLGRALVRDGVPVTAAVLGATLDESRRRAAIDAGLMIVEIEGPSDWLARSPEDVARIASALSDVTRRSGADVLHLNHPALAADAVVEQPILAACHSCLATWWQAVRGGPVPERLQWRVDLAGRGYRAAQTLVAPSRAFAEATQSAYALAELPEVIHNGRAPEPAAPHAALPIEAVFTAARLWDESKNAKTLDRIAALTTAPFRAAGSVEGPDGRRVELTHLDLVGDLDEGAMRDRFAERPVYVSAAVYEPFGLAVLEAAQAGCALVLSEIDSFREIWSEAALFAPANDEEAFAAAIGRLLSDPDLRADYAIAAQNRARAFGLDAFVDDTLALYQRILARA